MFKSFTESFSCYNMYLGIFHIYFYSSSLCSWRFINVIFLNFQLFEMYVNIGITEVVKEHIAKMNLHIYRKRLKSCDI